MAEHHFQPEGTELIPNLLDDGDASVRRHQEPQYRLRLQHRADVASAAPRGRLRDGRHPDRRTGDLRRRARLSHPRGRDLRLAADRPGRQPRDVRGRRRGHLQGVRGQAVLAQGQVLHDPAGGAVSRLHAEGDHAGAGAGAPAGRMLAADPERLGARLRLHGEVRHQRRDRRRLGRGRRGRAAHDRLPGGLCPARHQARTRRAAGARLPVPHRVEPRAGDPRGRAALRREHEDVRRIAPGAGADRRADRRDARSRRWPAPSNCRRSRMR